MAVYHITYVPELKGVHLFFNQGCNFSCHGCITMYHPLDWHLNKPPRKAKYKALSQEEVILLLKPLSPKKVIFFGLEPTVDEDFLPLAKMLKENFLTYNTLLTNGWEYMDTQVQVIDEVCVSIKAISAALFRDFTHQENPQRVLEHFQRYANYSSVKLRAESVFIPGYLAKEEIEKIACFIASVDPLIPYRIDAYIPIDAYLQGEGVKDRFRRPTEEEMQEALLVAKRHLGKVSILTPKGLIPKAKVRYQVRRIY